MGPLDAKSTLDVGLPQGVNLFPWRPRVGSGGHLRSLGAGMGICGAWGQARAFAELGGRGGHLRSLEASLLRVSLGSCFPVISVLWCSGPCPLWVAGWAGVGRGLLGPFSSGLALSLC